jgi:hypothetical protein
LYTTYIVKILTYKIFKNLIRRAIDMKMVNDVLSKAKGEDKINDIMTGKGSFSKSGFSDLTSALANDTSFKIKTYGKDGQQNGEVSISDLIRSDIKKTIEKAKFPQKSEEAVLDTAEIVTSGISEAIPYIVMEQIKCGKKFDLPQQPTVGGSIYLADVPGKTKTSKVRDPKTQESLGTVTTTSKDSVQIRAKSPVPSYLQTKVRKDANGKVI